MRWSEGDAKTFAPSLYAKSRKRKPTMTEDIDEGDEIDDGSGLDASPPDGTPS